MTGNGGDTDAFGNKSEGMAGGAFGASAPASRPQPPPAPAGWKPPGAAPTGGAPQPPVSGRTTPPDAIIALVLAIAGVMFCPLIPSLFALSYAGKAKRTIASDPQRYSGMGLVSAATFIAWASIALFVLGVILVVGGSISINS